MEGGQLCGEGMGSQGRVVIAAVVDCGGSANYLSYVKNIQLTTYSMSFSFI